MKGIITPDGRIGIEAGRNSQRGTFVRFADDTGSWYDSGSLQVCAAPAWAKPRRVGVVGWIGAGLLGLMVYGCMSSQLSRSGIEGYDERTPEELAERDARAAERRANLQRLQRSVDLLNAEVEYQQRPEQRERRERLLDSLSQGTGEP